MRKNAPLEGNPSIMRHIQTWRSTKKSIALMLSLFLLSLSLIAQTKIVTGIVKDEKGQPISGVSVRVDGTYVGTMTDADGKYTINVNTGATLAFSHVSFGKK